MTSAGKQIALIAIEQVKNAMTEKDRMELIALIESAAIDKKQK